MSKQMIIGEKTVTFPGSIFKVLAYQNLIIVLFISYEDSPHPREIGNRNVLAFDQYGDQVWAIEARPGEGWKSFLGMKINEENQLVVNHGSGFNTIVDATTGKIAPRK